MRGASMSRRPSLLGALLVFTVAVGTGAAVGWASAASGSTIVASPSGDDGARGTDASPLHSLARARDVARSASRTTPVNVRLAGGTYRLSAPLVLDARDSGVTWTAAPGAHPVVSGGVKVTGWTLTDAARGLGSAPLSMDTRQLYLNGARAQRARGPLPVTLKATATGYTASSPVMSGWRNPSDIEFVYTGGGGARDPGDGARPGGRGGCPGGAGTGAPPPQGPPRP